MYVSHENPTLNFRDQLHRINSLWFFFPGLYPAWKMTLYTIFKQEMGFKIPEVKSGRVTYKS